MKSEKKTCKPEQGSLPACAPLAVSYVPMQESAQPVYPVGKALVRGTLFPGLDLPFMGMVNNTELADTPLGELMALDFAIKELQLYLDTHADDAEAFEALQQYCRLFEEGRAAYVRMYGPLTIHDAALGKSYAWLKEPWPWEYCSRK